jgi:sigma-B regulation protein RsbU (phosphoserine phosphatase)
MPAQGAADRALTPVGLPPAALLVLSPSGQRTKIPLARLPFTMGRQSDNNLVLRDNRASRAQARIVADDGHYVIEDLQSRHGTWVNGERIARRILRHSDQIEFGVADSYQITFALESGGITRIMEQFAAASQSDKLDTGNLAKLRSLVEVARALQESLSTQEVLTAVVDAALAVTECERGFLLLRKDEGLIVSVARDSSGRPLEANELRVPTSVIQRALESRRELLSMSFDPLEMSGAAPDKTVASLSLQSVVCVPLVHVRSGSLEETRMTSAAESTAGLLYLDSRKAPADLSSGNRELLQTLAVEASTILENARLMEQERAKQRIDDELRIARDIQQGLLPAALPAAGWLRAAGSSMPATQVGGDYFDVRHVTPHVWAAVVADVSGKGVSSALLASLLQGAFTMASGAAGDIQPMLAHLNEFLLERTHGEKYATIFYCTIDSSGVLSYANAGHCAPFLVSSDGRIRKLHTTGMPVGMVEGATAQMVQTRLAPNDKIVVYSDGLTEAENGYGQFFDSDRLRMFLRDHAVLDAVEMHRLLMDVVDRFTEGGVVRDDITALILEYRGL